MEKNIPFSLLALTLLILACPALAADNATVNATVTLQNVSVSVADGTINYGILSLNSSTGTVALSDTQTVTNAGNVPVDILIKGQNSANWSIAGSAGNNAYVHRFCVSSCGAPVTNYTALTTNNQTLSSSVSASSTVSLDLHLTTPTASTNFAQQDVDVIITAVAS